MKCMVKREEILPRLNVVSAVSGKIPEGNTGMATESLRLSVAAGKLEITSTDMAQWVCATVPLVGQATEGSALLDAKKFGQIVRSLPDGSEIDIDVEGAAKIVSGRSRYRISAGNVETFPEMAQPDSVVTFRIQGAVFKRLLAGTVHAMAKDDAREYLNGARFAASNNLVRVTTTDGKRLAHCGHRIDEGPGVSVEVILPRRSVLELQRIINGQEDSPCEVSMFKNGMEVKVGEYVYQSSSMDGKYPNVENVIPNAPVASAVVDTVSMRDAVERVALVTENPRVELQFRKDGVLLCASENGNESSEFIDGGYSYEGEDLTVGMNHRFFADILAVSRTGRMKILLTSQIDAVKVVDATSIDGWDAVYVVMPMV